MIKTTEIKMGDYMMGEFEGKMWHGEVINVNNDEKQICLATNVQDFWFEEQNVFPIPISDESLKNLRFEREDLDDGSVKYKKGTFRILIAKPDDFSFMRVWYRDDLRHYKELKYIHQLQNQYLQMTKIHLTNEPVA